MEEESSFKMTPLFHLNSKLAQPIYQNVLPHSITFFTLTVQGIQYNAHSDFRYDDSG